jgi:hypothetical protein
MSALLETPEILETPEADMETKPAKPMIEFFTPSELSAFTPPEGFNLAGNYHIQKAAPFVIGGAPGVGKTGNGARADSSWPPVAGNLPAKAEAETTTRNAGDLYGWSPN